MSINYTPHQNKQGSLSGVSDTENGHSAPTKPASDKGGIRKGVVYSGRINKLSIALHACENSRQSNYRQFGEILSLSGPQSV